jgi:hypothetical protein
MQDRDKERIRLYAGRKQATQWNIMLIAMPRHASNVNEGNVQSIQALTSASIMVMLL